MAVRKVSNRGGNIIGHFPSLKMKRMVAFESLIERDYLYLLDFEPDVERFEEQPLIVEYSLDGKTLHYTPDFHIVRSGQNAMIECKPEELVTIDENRRKFAAARDWCAEHHWEFCVVTDRQIRAGFRLENIKLLTRHARHVVKPETKGRVYAVLDAARSPMAIGDLARTVSPTDLPSAIASILYLAFHHEVVVPLNDAAISAGSLVSLPLP